MTRMIKAERLLPNLVRFADTCHVYVISDGHRCMAVDFGSGAWVNQLDRWGLGRLERVYLTHHHADQCAGLEPHGKRGFAVHAPTSERAYLEPKSVKALHAARRRGEFPGTYAPLSKGLTHVQYDVVGNGDHFWHKSRIRFLNTPGHSRGAVSIIADVDGKQVVFCGDAAHDGATIHQPYHLEWDHWTGAGALAAFEGVNRLANTGMDLLCPSHGPVITARPRAVLRKLSRKLLDFYHAKGNICAGEKDHYLQPMRQLRCGAWQLLDSLYRAGGNSYLLTSASGEALLIDPHEPFLADLDNAVAELGNVKLTDMVATHYHSDHIDGAPQLMKRGVRLHLHPRVAAPLGDPDRYDVPFKLDRAIKPDHMLPRTGTWRWNEYRFRVAPFAGQTWWHAAHMTTIEGRKVLFGGDSFQPNTRWNGTGGFCSFNGARFVEGFARSAQLVLDWQPDLIVNGHGTYMHYHASQFRKIKRWAHRAEAATAALCPSGDLRKDYYLHPAKG